MKLTRVSKKTNGGSRFFTGCSSDENFADPTLCSVEIFLVIFIRSSHGTGEHYNYHSGFQSLISATILGISGDWSQILSGTGKLVQSLYFFPCLDSNALHGKSGKKTPSFKLNKYNIRELFRMFSTLWPLLRFVWPGSR